MWASVSLAIVASHPFLFQFGRVFCCRLLEAVCIIYLVGNSRIGSGKHDSPEHFVLILVSAKAARERIFSLWRRIADCLILFDAS